jgi:hypothetical protein
MKPAPATTNIIIRAYTQRRRRDGMPIMIRAAKREPPPPMGQKFSRAEVGTALVFTFSTAVPLPPPVRLTLTGLRLHVGTLCAPAGELIREQASPIVPVYVLPALRLTLPVPLDPAEIGDKEVTDITNGATLTFVVALAVV